MLNDASKQAIRNALDERDALAAALAATTCELYDALALATQLDRRGQAPPLVMYGQRRSDHDWHTAVCQCRGDEPTLFATDWAFR
jgi:hypothetical protein